MASISARCAVGFGFFMLRGVSMDVLAFVARDFCKEAFEI
jgi:hypothetical protein